MLGPSKAPGGLHTCPNWPVKHSFEAPKFLKCDSCGWERIRGLTACAALVEVDRMPLNLNLLQWLPNYVDMQCRDELTN
jgi:hypothetical protein